ncbi:MAG: gluconeogenesis factor YvcK family protein [bacterium]
MKSLSKKLQVWSKTRITVIGGGTGLSSLLSGLKKYTHHLTSIVTVTDDGGSSGTLREELQVLPPGDIRNCLVALADEETLLSKLFQYRFPGTGHLRGHSFGNLFLTAMADVAGGFDRGIIESSKVLAIRGRVLPVTLDEVRLRAETDNGIIYGETKIARTKKQIRNISLVPIPTPTPGPYVLKSISEADLIVLGPGSLFTSIIPNLLVDGVSESIANANGKKIFVCNIMTQPGETYGFTAQDHYRIIEKYLGKNIIDYIFINSGIISANAQKRYARKNSVSVHDDISIHANKNAFPKVKKYNFIRSDELVRHDSHKLAQAVLQVRSS